MSVKGGGCLKAVPGLFFELDCSWRHSHEQQWTGGRLTSWHGGECRLMLLGGGGGGGLGGREECLLPAFAQ